MPFDTGASVPMKDIPADLLAAAEETDLAIGDELASLIPLPEKPYGSKAMNALASAVAKVAKVMGMEVVPEKYTGPVPQMEDDLIRFLSMIEAASADYGSPLPVPLNQIRGDAELTAITAHLIGLASDPDFSKFLDGAVEAPEADAAGDDFVEPPLEPSDDLFASRMKPR